MSRLAAASLFCVVLAASACGGSAEPVSPSQPLDVSLTITNGQTATLDASSGLAVRFDAVTEDSRCPIDAMCISAGQAVVKVTITSANVPTTVQIQSDPVNARAARAGIVRVEWKQLEPYPSFRNPVQPSDYRLTLRVVRN
jgi:hypothetical protein